MSDEVVSYTTQNFPLGIYFEGVLTGAIGAVSVALFALGSFDTATIAGIVFLLLFTYETGRVRDQTIENTREVDSDE